MSRFYNLEQAPFNNRALARSIVAANNGLLFDPSDLSTLYQDAAGTIPVTAVGQPVGLVLDKSQGMMLGQELQPSGDFYGFSSGQDSISYNSSGFTNTIVARGVVKQMLVVGRFYEISINATSTTTFSVNTTNDLLPTMRTELRVGNGTTKFLATSTFIYIRNNNVGTTTINLLTIRELYGNHATQPITASRPTLVQINGLYGLSFDGIDDYLNLPYMGLYDNGAASIVAARDALSQATDTYVISERSTSNVNPKYFPSRQLANAGNMDSYIVNDAAAVVVDTVGSAYGGASDAVVRSSIDSGNSIKLFKNGALAANENYTRSGALTLTNTTIGASVSTATSNYANMKLYGLCIAKSALSDLERRRVERLLAYNSGVQI